MHSARPHHLNVKIPDRQKSELKFEAAVHIVDQFNNVVNTGNLGPNDYPPNPTFSVENDTVKVCTLAFRFVPLFLSPKSSLARYDQLEEFADQGGLQFDRAVVEWSRAL